MATLHEFFIKDGANGLTTHQQWSINDATGRAIAKVTARVHYDIEAYSRYISFYIPAMTGVVLPEALVLGQAGQLLKVSSEEVGIIAGFDGERASAKDLVFTGQIYFYSESPVDPELKARLTKEAEATGCRLTFRSTDYVTKRNKCQIGA